MEVFQTFEDLNRAESRIENVMIFVSDALRWDYLPDSVAKRGVTFKTVASSLFTAASFPSMATGVYPSSHGVYADNNYVNR